MKNAIIPALLLLLFSGQISAQDKTMIAVLPFRDPGNNGNSYNQNSNTVAIQDAVSDAFLKAKRFRLVEREKLDKLKSEKNLQQGPDFIDGKVIEQSKNLGAQYVVVGNITNESQTTSTKSIPIIIARVPVTNSECDVNFSLRIVDVETSEDLASAKFSEHGKGKKCFDAALDHIKPQIEKFIKDNFKVTATVVEVTDSGSNGIATKVRISAGNLKGVSANNGFKVYELRTINVDGKMMEHKNTIGTITIEKVEDENFSICTVNEGGETITKKLAANAKIKCELISE